jgi:hypothetical protein
MPRRRRVTKQTALFRTLRAIAKMHREAVNLIKDQIEELDRSYGNGHVIEALEGVIDLVRGARREVYGVARLKPRPTV